MQPHKLRSCEGISIPNGWNTKARFTATKVLGYYRRHKIKIDYYKSNQKGNRVEKLHTCVPFLIAQISILTEVNII